jgi:tellurite resistance-related uncharacterized protein
VKGYPSNFNTKEDYYNCLAMMQAGKLDAAGLKEAIDALEEQRYIHTSILSRSAENKEVSIRLCQEVAVGAAFYCGNVTGTVKSAVAKHSANTDEQQDTMELTLSAAIPDAENMIHIISSVDNLALVGMTEDDIKAIKGVLKQYE